MKTNFAKLFCSLATSLAIATSIVAADAWVSTTASGDAFELAAAPQVAGIVVDANDFEVVRIATEDLGEDLRRVTGESPEIHTKVEGSLAGKVVVGTLGQSAVVDRLVKEFGLELGDLEGAWESFIVTVLGEGEASVLAIVGSDRRGTAYGIYELSQAIGVSPWYWWADVPAKQSKQLYVSKGLRRFGPPSVKYRGIFINDEDWGLHPWASKTFDPELGDIGPKTYERVFELLLRLKANTLWPAMHEITNAFNLYPENKFLAERYGIVMGSSHAEPMLRNNVTEWTEPKNEYNYETHPEKVRSYWEGRLIENGGFENTYTLGMRGIHDSGMRGGGSDEEKIALIEKIFADQRELLKRHVNEDLSQVAQVFTPYKEVLDLYQGGLQVPEDVSIVWPDDNFGYLRRFPNEKERALQGGSGVYYHLSYLGAPLAYLWLDTIRPALVWEEMRRSYELGSRNYWIVNVGDIKPHERGMEFFLSLAWDIDRWGRDAQSAFLADWAKREFGAEVSLEIADLLNEFYELNNQRRPEHLQWWMPYTRLKTSPLTEVELRERLGRFLALIEACDAIESRIPEEARDAFFQLVAYPVKGSAYMNLQYFHLEQYFRFFRNDFAMARLQGGMGKEAALRLEALTARYNDEIAGGKWRHMMAVEPADSAWRVFRTTPWVLPVDGMIDKPSSLAEAFADLEFRGARPSEAAEADVWREAEDFDRSGGDGGSWEVVDGLGWSGDALAVFPMDLASVSIDQVSAATPWVEYDLQLAEAGEHRLFIDLVPSFPSDNSGELSLAVSFDGGDAVRLSLPRKSKTEEWADGVLDGKIGFELPVQVDSPGKKTLRLIFLDTGTIVDRIYLHHGELEPSFTGPAALH